MQFGNIIFEKKAGVAKITLNRPDVLNALNAQTLQEIGAAVENIENDSSVRVVVLTANGRAFCTGADLTGGELLIGLLLTSSASGIRYLTPSRI